MDKIKPCVDCWVAVREDEMQLEMVRGSDALDFALKQRRSDQSWSLKYSNLYRAEEENTLLESLRICFECFTFCPDCGQRIDWDKILVEPGRI